MPADNRQRDIRLVDLVDLVDLVNKGEKGGKGSDLSGGVCSTYEVGGRGFRPSGWSHALDPAYSHLRSGKNWDPPLASAIPSAP